MRPKISTRLEPSIASWEKVASTAPYRSKKDEVTASRASTKEALSSSGTRKSRSLATRVSRTATATAKTTTFTAKTPTAVITASSVSARAKPQGTKRLPSRKKNTRNLRAAAHSIRARQ